MQRTMRPKARGIAWMLMLVYFASYMTRINFTVMLVKICADMQVDKIDLAAVVTALTITYGAGQLVSGFIGDRIKPKYLLTFGLLLAVACNVVMACSKSIPFMTGVWCVNGFAHALLWPPMVRLMSIYLTDEEYGYACVRVAWGSSTATILLYLACPVLLGWMSWRWIMALCAALVLGIAAAWVISTKKLLNEPLVKLAKPTEAQGARMAVPRFVALPIVLIMLAILMQGVLRDGVTNWMPSYLLETFGLKEEQAIVVTVVQAVFSMASFYVFDLMHRKWFKNEVTCAGVIFGMSAVFALVMALIGSSGSVAVSAVLMALIVACMHGVNLMLVSVVPKRFTATGNVSFYSGLVNSCTYVGAALSTYGFAALADGMGWSTTILSWVLFAVLGLALSFAAVPLWRKFRAMM